MTLDDVKERVESIKASAGDDEAAHSAEDSLHQSVLYAIANGADNAVELATAALETQDISFCRWCA